MLYFRLSSITQIVCLLMSYLETLHCTFMTSESQERRNLGKPLVVFKKESFISSVNYLFKTIIFYVFVFFFFPFFNLETKGIGDEVPI